MLEANIIRRVLPNIYATDQLYRVRTAERRLIWKVGEWKDEGKKLHRAVKFPLAMAALGSLQFTRGVYLGTQVGMELVTHIRGERGREVNIQLEETPEDVESEKRALTVKPLEVKQIGETARLRRGKWDPALVSYYQKGEEVQLVWGDEDLYSVVGVLREGYLGGERKRIIFSLDNPCWLGINMFENFFTCSQEALRDFRKDPEIVITSLLHELVHDRYASLSALRQRDLNNFLLNNFQLKNHLFRFGTALYTDPRNEGNITTGGQYLRRNSIEEVSQSDDSLTSPWGRGIKDRRSVRFELNGQYHEISLGYLIGEFLAYMSDLQMGRRIFDKVHERGKQFRNGIALRYDVIHLAYRYIQSDPEVKRRFDSFGLFRNNTSTLILDFARLASTVHFDSESLDNKNEIKAS